MDTNSWMTVARSLLPSAAVLLAAVSVAPRACSSAPVSAAEVSNSVPAVPAVPAEIATCALSQQASACVALVSQPEASVRTALAESWVVGERLGIALDVSETGRLTAETARGRAESALSALKKELQALKVELDVSITDNLALHAQNVAVLDENVRLRGDTVILYEIGKDSDLAAATAKRDLEVKEAADAAAKEMCTQRKTARHLACSSAVNDAFKRVAAESDVGSVPTQIPYSSGLEGVRIGDQIVIANGEKVGG